VAIATKPTPLTLPLPGGSVGATVRVSPLRCGEVLLPPRAFDRPSGPLSQLRAMGPTVPRSRWSWAPVPVFLIEHPTAGRLLVDTGFHASAQDDPRTSLGRRQAFVLPARQAPGESAPEQLRARGIDPAQIELVVMTHLHNDHASGAIQFPEATFVVDGAEWVAASAGGFAEGYRREHYDQPLRWHTVDYAAAGAGPHGAFERTLDLFGDGSVRLLATPGHTLGHQSLLLALEGRELLLTGDAAYTRRTIDEHLVPIFCADAARYRHSLAQVHAHAAEHPDTIVVPGHDAELWPRLQATYF
jgi:glyoxylase-like metal-dependent hydrolase (beta-lactamase superfamily II)